MKRRQSETILNLKLQVPIKLVNVLEKKILKQILQAHKHEHTQ